MGDERAKKAVPKKAAPKKAAGPAKKAAPAKKATPAEKPTAAVKKAPVKKAPVKKAAPAKKTAPARKAAPASRAIAPGENAAPSAAAAGDARAQEAAPAVETAPAEEVAVQTTPAASTVASAPPTPSRQSTATLWTRLKAQPIDAQETLAGTAVEQYGAAAKLWADELRATYPGAPARGMAKLAVDKFARLAGGAGAASVLAGPLGPVAGGSSQVLLQIQLVLHIAAAYGADPTAPERAAELRDLIGGRRTVTRWAGAWTLWRAASRLLPGTAVALGALGGANELRRVAARAEAHYRAAGDKIETARSTPEP